MIFVEAKKRSGLLVMLLDIEAINQTVSFVAETLPLKRNCINFVRTRGKQVAAKS